MSQAAELNVNVTWSEEVTKGLKTLQSGIIRFVGAITAGVAAVGVVTFPIRQSIEFERALANIAKTTQFTSSQINRVGQALRQMSTESSRSALDLAQIATVAGQLGLGARAGVAGIIEFTRVIQMAATALNVAEEDAAKMGAQILNIYKYEPGQTENILSVINELSNTSVARGEEIADIVSRIGTVAGLAFPQVAALAAYAKDLGISTEVAGTSFVKIFTRMLSSADKFSELMQISTDEWVAKIEKDAVGALKEALRVVSTLGAATQAQTINQLFGQGRVYALTAKLVADASNEFVLLNEHLGTASEQFRDGTSIAAEFAAVMATTEEQIQQTKNSLLALSGISGSQSLPFLQQMMADIREWAARPATKEMAQELGQELLNVVKSVAAIGQAIADLNIDWSKMYNLLKLIVAWFVGKMALAVASFAAGKLNALTKISEKWEQIRRFVDRYNAYISNSTTLVGGLNAALAQTLNITKQQAALARQPITSMVAAGGAPIDPVSGGKSKEFELARAIANEKERQIRLNRITLAQNQAISASLKQQLAAESAKLQQMLSINRATGSMVSMRVTEQVRTVQALREEIAARNRIIAQTSGQLGQATKQLNTQQAILATVRAEGGARSVAVAAMVPQLSLTQRLSGTMAALGKMIGGSIAAIVLMGGAFFVVTKVLEKLLKQFGIIDNEQKRLAREERALERQRRADIEQRAEVALEVYNRIVKAAKDADEQIASLDMFRVTETGRLDSSKAFTELRDSQSAVENFQDAIRFMGEESDKARERIAELEDRIKRSSDAIQDASANVGDALADSFFSSMTGDQLPTPVNENEIRFLREVIATNNDRIEDFQKMVAELVEATVGRAVDVLSVIGGGDTLLGAEVIAIRERLKEATDEIRSAQEQLYAIFDSENVPRVAISDIDDSVLENLSIAAQTQVTKILAEYNRLQEARRDLITEESALRGVGETFGLPLLEQIDRMADSSGNLEAILEQLRAFGVGVDEATSDIVARIEAGIIVDEDKQKPSLQAILGLQMQAAKAREELSKAREALISLGNAYPALRPLIENILATAKSSADLTVVANTYRAAAAAIVERTKDMTEAERTLFMFTRDVIMARGEQAEKLASIQDAESLRRRVLEEEAALLARVNAYEEERVELVEESADAISDRVGLLTEELAAQLRSLAEQGIPFEDDPSLEGMVTRIGEGAYVIGNAFTQAGEQIAVFVDNGTLRFEQLSRAVKDTENDINDIDLSAGYDPAVDQQRLLAIQQQKSTLEGLVNTRKEEIAALREQLILEGQRRGLPLEVSTAVADEWLATNKQVTREQEAQYLIASGQVKSVSQMRSETMLTLASLRMQEETIRYAAGEYLAMAQNARSFANNIASWSNNFRRETARIGADIRQNFRDRQLNIRIKLEQDEFDKDIERQKDEIRRRWQPIIAEALRGGSRFRVQELQKQRDAELAAAEAAGKNAKAQIEYDRRMEQQNRTYQGVRERLVELARLEGQINDPGGPQQYNQKVVETEALLERAAEGLRRMMDLRDEGAVGGDGMFVTEEMMNKEIARFEQLREEFRQRRVVGAPIIASTAEKFSAPILVELEAIQSGILEAETSLKKLGVPVSVIASWRNFAQYLGTEFVGQMLSGFDQVSEALRTGTQPIDLTEMFRFNPENAVTGFTKGMAESVRQADMAGVTQALNEAMSRVELSSSQVEQMFLEMNRYLEQEGMDFRYTLTGEIVRIEVPSNLEPEDTPKISVEAEASDGAIQKAVDDAQIPTTPVNALFTNSQIQNAATAAAKGVRVTLDADLRIRENAKGGYVQTRARGGYIEAPGYAAGGRISGPGTGTSDSILSWLSNGEYVMDAWTTRVFGSKFFSVLQSIARGGLGSSVRKKLKGVVPGFASGGPVTTSIQNNSMLTQLAGAAAGGSNVVQPSETVNLNLNIGRETFSLQGPRDQVKGLVESIKSVNRGTMK
jgi:TP901 family phage tail tape measure protein